MQSIRTRMLLVFFGTPTFSPSVIMKIVVAIALLCALPWSNSLSVENGERIIGGSQAQRNQFPYMVAIHKKFSKNYRFACGGVILSPRWIVSGAYCLKNVQDQDTTFKVVAGGRNIKDHHKDVQIVYASGFMVPQDYNPYEPYNDIGLLRLESLLTFNDAVQPIAIPEKDQEYSGEAVLTGWGFMSMRPPLMPTSLQYLKMPIITNKECNNLLSKTDNAVFLVKDTMLCTLPTDEQTSCYADEGSPLVQDGVLIGVVLPRQCTPGSPQMFTKVGSFRYLLDYALSRE